MNKLFKGAALLMGVAALSLTSCSDDDNVTTVDPSNNPEIKGITEQYLNGTVYPTYTILANGTDTLYNKLSALRERMWDEDATNDQVSDAELKEISEIFLRARANYELSEAFLFGAASDFGIDPHIDSWPLDETALKQGLTNTAVIDALKSDDGTYASTALPTACLGFHGIEYVLFRDGKVRSSSNQSINEPDANLNDLSGKLEITYAAAVAGDLRNSCVQMEVSWVPDASAEHKQLVEDLGVNHEKNGRTYGEDMLATGTLGSSYTNWISVLSDILSAGCANIANEVYDVKMGKPYGTSSEGEDEDYIESPYSHNSIQDFTHNIQSIENSIFGGRPEKRDESKSLYKYVNDRNPQLASELKSAIENAISKTKAMKAPFVTYKKDPSVKTAIDAVSALNDKLNEVDQWVKTQD